MHVALHGKDYILVEKGGKEMKFSNTTYNALKGVAQIWLPAAGTLYFALAQIWHLPGAEQVTGTVVAVDAFLGVILGISTSAYNNSEDKFGGTLAIQGGSYLRLRGIDPNAVLSQKEITFKIIQEPLPAEDTMVRVPKEVPNTTDPRLLQPPTNS